jgi:hypothetical protein
VNVYVSGSAYKIVNNRAYHHGTMLISTQLDTLGDLLRVKGKVSGTLSTSASLLPLPLVIQMLSLLSVRHIISVPFCASVYSAGSSVGRPRTDRAPINQAPLVLGLLFFPAFMTPDIPLQHVRCYRSHFPTTWGDTISFFSLGQYLSPTLLLRAVQPRGAGCSAQ